MWYLLEPNLYLTLSHTHTHTHLLIQSITTWETCQATVITVADAPGPSGPGWDFQWVWTFILKAVAEWKITHFARRMSQMQPLASPDWAGKDGCLKP